MHICTEANDGEEVLSHTCIHINTYIHKCTRKYVQIMHGTRWSNHVARDLTIMRGTRWSNHVARDLTIMHGTRWSNHVARDLTIMRGT